MIKTVFLAIVFAVVSGYEINFGCSDYCNDCINKNIAPTLITHNQCAMTRESTHFRISVRGNNNGCGYAQDINDVIISVLTNVRHVVRLTATAKHSQIIHFLPSIVSHVLVSKEVNMLIACHVVMA
jgi:hypothetical protein